MVDTPHVPTAPDAPRLARRDYLATAGSLGIGLASGCLGVRPPRAAQAATNQVPSRSTPSREQSDQREDFLWLGSALWRDAAVRRNLFAFARRHNLAVVLVHSDRRHAPLDETLDPALVAASQFGLDVWLNVGLLADITAETFVTDADAREASLDRLREIARRHGELFENGRVICWQEAPVMGQWSEGGHWNQAAVENLVALGPTIFAAQQAAIREANDALDVGLFVHFPYIVDSKQPEVFRTLATGLREYDALPDFGFTDFYRGWYEKDVGPEPANEAVRSLISNARDALDGRPVFYLGQSHTINPSHTPSTQALRMNLRISIDAGAAGLGWYCRSGYQPTTEGFDPFVPNVDGATLEGESVYTLTVARDRFLYAWLATLDAQSGFDPSDAFDLWLVGDGFGFYDHRLSVRTADGTWEYVGDFGGYADGDFPADSEATHRATVFRALDRDRLLADGTLDCRIETSPESSGASLLGAYVMPCDPDTYVTERDAAAFHGASVSLDAFSLGQTTERTSFPPGTTRRVTIPSTADGGRSLAHLRHPEYVDEQQRLARFEARTTLAPSSRFDLWVAGTGLTDPARLPSLLDRDGVARAPADVGIVAATDALAICHGLDRDRFLAGGDLQLADDPGVGVEAVYAMPYAGSATFRAPTHAATLLAEQPEEATTFCLDVVRPG